ncbi:outer membrane protein assembly factor BamB family protein [Kribbia dieselivorans]|uniref:outer membrane protein assembly factor BamB family protein n=1 Tax=Kribbia dieselivorans TaxID=331526 RepID=UPI00083940BE|nr:PQQ-binding-like beta-propeller repeat protein [Kribbia dieselivorans]
MHPAPQPTQRWNRRLRLAFYGTFTMLAGGVVAGPLTTVVAEAIDPPTAMVSGAVYDDRNGNDRQDAGEPGIADVAVSDGVQIVRTDADGRYTLETRTDRRITDQVFISQPSGWSVGTDEFKTARFYRTLGELSADATPTADFALTKDAKSTRDQFSFGNIADPHVNAQLPQQIEEINSTTKDLGFIQISGDLTNNATDAEFNRYKAGTAKSKLPIWPAVGNHEYSSGSSYAARIDNYRRHVGPEWYSFDYGNRHFIVLENNGAAPFDEQYAWAEQDLAQNVGDKELVLLMHQPMNVPFGSGNAYDRFGPLLEKYGVQLILVGHEHSNDTENQSVFAPSAKHIQTVSSSYTIDNAPRGFRYVHMSGAEFTNPFRIYGHEQELVVTSPANGSRIPVGGFPGLQVNAYDTSDPAVKLRYRVDGKQWFNMDSTGNEYTWRGHLQFKNNPNPPKSGTWVGPGKHTVEVEATDAAGRSWSTSSTFTVTTDEVVAPKAGANWAQHHGSASHAGVSPNAIDAGQRLAWTYNTKGVFLTGSPVIVDGVVYAATRDENGDGNSAVSAIELSSGRELWTHRMPTSVHGSIAVADGKVFASTLRGKLYALDTATGDELWKLAPEDAPEPYNQRAYGYYGVTYAEGKVLWPYQSRHGKGSQGLLSAVDAETGKVVWESPMSGATMADGTPAVSDGKVFVGSQTADRVLAYDLETGKRLWQGQEALGGWQDGIPSAANGRVFIGSNNRIIARDADTGKELWRFQSPHPSLVNGGATPAAPAIDGDIVYMGFPSGAVTALDARTGAVIWDRKLPGKLDMGGVHSSPAVAGESLFVGSNNGNFYALDKRTGQPLWQHEIGAWVSAGPAVSGNSVVAGSYDGNLYAYAPGGQAAQKWGSVHGVVTDSESGAPADGITVTLRDESGTVGSTTTVADGSFTIAAQPGTYTVSVAKRGYLPTEHSEQQVTIGQTGQTTVNLSLTKVTKPVAGLTTVAPDYGNGSGRPDVVAGDEHAFVMNDRVRANIVSRIGANNEPGTFQPGWLADIGLTDSTAMETLDWSEMVLSTQKPRTGWNRPGEWLTLGDISAQGPRVVAAGQAQIDADLKTKVSYETLPDSPIVKMQLEVRNTGQADFGGYFSYVLDPDSSQDVARIPGVSGTNPGLKTSGWTANYVYDGASSQNGQPAHGIAWADDEPAAVTAEGYIFGAHFDASVKAGGTRTITWYHITDYPSAGNVTSQIANWAALIPSLDPAATPKPVVRGSVKASDTGTTLAAQRVEALDADNKVVAEAYTVSDGSYVLPVPAGEYTIRTAALGYATATAKVSVTDKPVTANLTLDPVAVDAGIGAQLSGSLVEGTTSDLVLQNNRLAMSVSAGSNDSQLNNSTVGKIRDFAARGKDDQIDWVNLPYVTATQPTGTEAWQQLQVKSTKVEVAEKSADRAVVRVTGASTENPDITVTTEYLVEPDRPWVSVSSVFRNSGSSAAKVWVGDAMDHDGSGQRSLVSGHPVITTGYDSPAPYAPTGRWIGATGNDGQVYGLVYAQGAGEFTGYGNGNWIMSQVPTEIPAGGEYRLDRRVVVTPSNGDPIATLEEIAAR